MSTDSRGHPGFTATTIRKVHEGGLTLSKAIIQLATRSLADGQSALHASTDQILAAIDGQALPWDQPEPEQCCDQTAEEAACALVGLPAPAPVPDSAQPSNPGDPAVQVLGLPADPATGDGGNAQNSLASPHVRAATLRWVLPFLAALRMTPNIRVACEAAGVSRKTVNRLRGARPGFEAAVRACLNEGKELLEAAVWQRAVEGTLEPVYQKGLLVDHKLVYSDKLAEALLKANANDLTASGANYHDEQNINLKAAAAKPKTQAEIAATVRRVSPLVMARAQGKALPQSS